MLLRASLHVVTDIGLVVEDQNCARLHGRARTLEQAGNVPGARRFSQVSLGRPWAYRRECTAQRERMRFNFVSDRTAGHRAP